MSERPMQEQQPDNSKLRHVEDVSPDALMQDFRGRPLVTILIVTLIVHALFIGVFSFGYLKGQILGEDTSSMTEGERMEIAVREGTIALREIAERYELSVQDLSSQFSGGSARPAARVDDAQREDAASSAPNTDAPDEPASDIERTLQETEVGPEDPELEDDLFAPETP